MKHKNRKGFTLIEMLVVIAVIGALSVAIGVSANQMMESSQKNDYEETYKEIMKNARIYVEIEYLINNLAIQPFSLQKLIDKGLQDDKILFQKNPVYEDGRLFYGEGINIKVVLDANGKKNVTIEVPGCPSVTSDNIDNYEWGKC